MDDVFKHEPDLEAAEMIISDLSVFTSESHSLQLLNKLKTFSQRFYTFKFNLHCLPVLSWLHDRSIEFFEMKACAVLIVPLQAQTTAIQAYRKIIDDHSATLTALNDLSLHDQVDISEPRAKLAEIKDQYDALQRLSKVRFELLNSFYPQVMLYNDSLNKWEELVKQWTELAADMDEPTATLPTLKDQIDETKVRIEGYPFIVTSLIIVIMYIHLFFSTACFV